MSLRGFLVFVFEFALVVLMERTAVPAFAQPMPIHVDVFVSGTDGYFAYRIPAIETSPDGSLLAFAEARKYNLDDPGFGGASRISIWCCAAARTTVRPGHR